MGKSKKKRNKKYAGVDAKQTDNVMRVHRVAAVVRSPLQQWLHEHRKLVRRGAIAVAIVAVVVFIIVQAFIV
ncbi:hypothetical protein FWD20_00765 [Candidatus Saccharibacteria bacterium]|nr:hypothetical protein [Candidatus Saccharibacteria bacterium]